MPTPDVTADRRRTVDGAAGTSPQLGRSATKHRAILAAAQTVFLRHGYDGATMDDVASLAAVSKQTVYKHFADKKRLFTAIVEGEMSSAESVTHQMVEDLATSDDIARDLHRFARQHIADVIQPHLIQLRRIVLAQVEQFPELARDWYANGPERAHTVMADQFRILDQRGVLQIADPLLAAQHLNWLILAIPLNKAMFQGSDTTFAREELDRYADEGVRVFLAGYAADR